MSTSRHSSSSLSGNGSKFCQSQLCALFTLFKLSFHAYSHLAFLICCQNGVTKSPRSIQDECPIGYVAEAIIKTFVLPEYKKHKSHNVV